VPTHPPREAPPAAQIEALDTAPAPPIDVGDATPAAEPSSYAEAPALTDVAPIEIVAPRTPGRFETDTQLGIHAKLYDAPHKRREFVMYVPAGWTREARAPLLVLCHGCKQTPEELASGSRIAELADQLGCLVLMPRQTKWANPWRCWNWFDANVVAGDGEAAIVAAQIRFIRQRYRADTQRVAVGGISAGAALAAVLGVRYPRHIRAVITTAGVACGAAAGATGASEVMRHGPNADVGALAAEARAKGGGSRSVALLAIHGDADPVVAPMNSVALVRQYLRFNGHPSLADATAGPDTFPSADDVSIHRTPDGRDVTTREWRMDGHLVARHVGVAGLGHAWGGGDEAWPFNDAHAPNATALVGQFLSEVFTLPIAH
jgi:poly(hydroxyalkanoate) depolymerase family esterase